MGHFSDIEIVEKENIGHGVDKNISFLKGKRIISSGFVDPNDDFPEGIIFEYEEDGKIKRAVICHDRQWGFYVAWNGVKGEMNPVDVLAKKIEACSSELISSTDQIRGNPVTRSYDFLREDKSVIMSLIVTELKIIGGTIASQFCHQNIDHKDVVEKLWVWSNIR